MEYKDGLPVLNYEKLVSYIMEESQYPKQILREFWIQRQNIWRKLELFRKKGYRLSEVQKELLPREFNPRLRISRFTDYLCGNLRQCSRTCSHLLKRNCRMHWRAQEFLQNKNLPYVSPAFQNKLHHLGKPISQNVEKSTK